MSQIFVDSTAVPLAAKEGLTLTFALEQLPPCAKVTIVMEAEGTVDRVPWNVIGFKTVLLS